jgi:hypothetical protein
MVEPENATLTEKYFTQSLDISIHNMLRDEIDESAAGEKAIYTTTHHSILIYIYGFSLEI